MPSTSTRARKSSAIQQKGKRHPRLPLPSVEFRELRDALARVREAYITDKTSRRAFKLLRDYKASDPLDHSLQRAAELLYRHDWEQDEVARFFEDVQQVLRIGATEWVGVADEVIPVASVKVRQKGEKEFKLFGVYMPVYLKNRTVETSDGAVEARALTHGRYNVVWRSHIAAVNGGPTEVTARKGRTWETAAEHVYRALLHLYSGMGVEVKIEFSLALSNFIDPDTGETNTSYTTD